MENFNFLSTGNGDIGKARNEIICGVDEISFPRLSAPFPHFAPIQFFYDSFDNDEVPSVAIH